jgi:dTDP-4-amino-4,6-dideoxygalactose transaminase
MIKFCSPVIPDMDRVTFYLKESFEKKHLSNFGPAYQLLVERLREFLNLDASKDILLCSSGHTALMAAYRALDLTHMFMPAYTFKSTESAATLQGIYRLLVDVDQDTGCLNQLPAYGYKSPDGLVAVCALSTIPDLAALEKKAKTMNAKLVVDGAATFGTHNIYNYGDAFCLSFHATKTFPIGECGALIADKRTIEIAKQYINFGFNKERIPQFTGINAKISEYTAAIGLALLEKMPAAIQARHRNANIYRDQLKDLIPKSAFGTDTVYQTMPIFFKHDFERARKVRAKLVEAGVEILQYYRPLDYFPNTQMLYSTNVCLPCHQDMTPEEVFKVCDIIKKC